MFGGHSLTPGVVMWHRNAVVSVLALCVLAITGCQSPASDETFGTPTPPDQGVATGDATSEEALYAEAEQIYRAMRVEMLKLERAGGADELPPELAQYVTGYLEDTLTAQFRRWKKEQRVVYGRANSLEWVRPSDYTHEGSEVTVAVCMDARNSQVSTAGTPVRVSMVAINYYYFKHFNGELKGFQAQFEQVESCTDA